MHCIAEHCSGWLCARLVQRSFPNMHTRAGLSHHACACSLRLPRSALKSSVQLAQVNASYTVCQSWLLVQRVKHTLSGWCYHTRTPLWAQCWQSQAGHPARSACLPAGYSTIPLLLLGGDSLNSHWLADVVTRAHLFELGFGSCKLAVEFSQLVCQLPILRLLRCSCAQMVKLTLTGQNHHTCAPL